MLYMLLYHKFNILTTMSMSFLYNPTYFVFINIFEVSMLYEAAKGALGKKND